MIWPNCIFKAYYNEIELKKIVMTLFHHHYVTEKRHQNNVILLSAPIKISGYTPVHFNVLPEE